MALQGDEVQETFNCVGQYRRGCFPVPQELVWLISYRRTTAEHAEGASLMLWRTWRCVCVGVDFMPMLKRAKPTVFFLVHEM